MNEARTLPTIETFPDRQVLAEAAASVIGEALNRSLCEGAARASLVATGGSTPAAAYEALSAWPLDWSRVEVTLSDERWAAPSSPDSNERMVREHLLRGAAAAARFTPLWSDTPTPEDAARRAETAVRRLLPADVALLGMGEDGHIASLFPGNPVLAEGLKPDGERLCLGVPSGAPAPPQPRISLTLAALLQSRLVVVLTSGEPKRRAMESALAGAALPVRALLDQDRTPVRILWAA